MNDVDRLLHEDAARWRRFELPALPDLDAAVQKTIENGRLTARPRRRWITVAGVAAAVAALAVGAALFAVDRSTTTPVGGTGCAASPTAARDCDIAQRVARAHMQMLTGAVGASGWPAGLQLLTVTSRAGTITDSNTGHRCTSGRLLVIDVWGKLRGIEIGASAPSGAEPIGLELTADAASGTTCELGVFATGAPISAVAPTVVYPVGPVRVAGSIREIGGPAPGINRGVPGTVTITAGQSRRTLKTSADGTFHATLRPGRYNISGVSSQLSGMQCLAPDGPVTVGAGQTTVIVACNIP